MPTEIPTLVYTTSTENTLTQQAPRKADFINPNFAPGFIEARSEYFRKDHASFLTIADAQVKAWDAELEHYRDLKNNKPDEYHALFDENELEVTPEELVLEHIQDSLQFVREQQYTKERLASEEVLPDLLGHLSAAVKIVFPKFSEGLRHNQMEAIIAGIIGNNKPKAQHALGRQLDRIKDLAHWSPFSPELLNYSEGKGNVVEVPTGEGKTLVDAVTAIIFTLEGPKKAVWISSANDYLASEGLQQMGKLYEALGITASYLAPQSPNNPDQEQFIYNSRIPHTDGQLSFRALSSRPKAYACQVTYAALEEFGFDYLRDSIEVFKPLRQVNGLGEIIVDEIHEAISDTTSPLIITKPYTSLNSETQLMEVSEPDVEVEGKVFAPKELHQIFANIVGLLDQNDFVVNRNDQSIHLYDPRSEGLKTSQTAYMNTVSLGKNLFNKGARLTHLPLFKPKSPSPPPRQHPEITRELAHVQAEERLQKIGVLSENESLETTTKFNPSQKERIYIAFQSLGIDRVTELMKVYGLIDESMDHFYESEDTGTFLYYLQPALNASSEFRREGFDFVRTPEGGIQILDPNLGRFLGDREWSEGGQQAVQAKLGSEISLENKTTASITYPEFLNLFPQVVGFTANALEYAQDFNDLFHLDVIQIPPHVASQRQDDLTEVIYPTQEDKFEAIFTEEIIPILTADVQRPILIGVHGEKEVLTFHSFLREKLQTYMATHPDVRIDLDHVQYVTHANRHEAHERFGHAGEEGYITISDMAGIGVDPILGGERPSLNQQKEAAAIEEALSSITLGGLQPQENEFSDRTSYEDQLLIWKAKHKRINDAGGLCVIGEHGDYVADAQLRGRAGRNGDKGKTKFYSAQGDYFLAKGIGEGTNKLAQIEYTGRYAERLVKHAQRYLMLDARLGRESLNKTHEPVQIYRGRFMEKRQEVYKSMISDLQRIPQRLIQDPDSHLSIYDSQVGTLINNYARRMANTMATDYEHTLQELSPENRAQEAPQVLASTIERYCETFGIIGNDRQNLQDLITQASPDYIMETQQILPPEILDAVLTHFVTTYYQEQMTRLVDSIREQYLEQNSSNQNINDLQLSINTQQPVILQQARILLTLMDERWIEYYEQRIKMNRHILSTQPENIAIPLMQQQAAESFDDFFGDSLIEEATTSLFKGLATSMS